MKNPFATLSLVSALALIFPAVSDAKANNNLSMSDTTGSASPIVEKKLTLSTPDMEMLELRGPVKTVSKNGWRQRFMVSDEILSPLINNFEVSKEGTVTPHANNYRYLYDDSGYMIKRLDYNLPEYPNGWVDMTIEWTPDRKIRSITYSPFSYTGLGASESYIYDKAGNIASKNYKYYGADQNTDITINYSIIESDSHGNWTKRDYMETGVINDMGIVSNVKKNGTEERIITYYE